MTVFLTSEQVVDGNRKMILGLIWRLILATQIVTLQTTKGVLGGDERQIDGGARAALLEWCRKRLAPYKNVQIDNFTTSWQSGMPFLALIHSQNPNLINYDALDPNRPPDNLELAFTIAENEFQIARLLEVQDVLQEKPDERCIMTYVSEYAYKFDILGKPVEDKIKTLDAREQAIAMREAELERQAFEQAQQLKNLHEMQLTELQEKERHLAASHQQLSQMEMEQKAQLERALQMQRDADARMEQAARLDQQAQMAAEDAARRAAELEHQRQALKAAQEAQLQQLQAKEQQLAASHQQLSQREMQQKAELERAMQMQREAEARIAEAQRLGAEAQRKNEELNKQHQQAEMEKSRLAEYEKQLKSQADRLAAQTAALEAQQKQMSHQQQLEAIEKEFADCANAMDKFLVEEDRKIKDPSCTLQTLEPINKFGIEHGEGLLQQVRAAAERAGKLGLQQNRYTTHTLAGLDERWKAFLAALKQKTVDLERAEYERQMYQAQQQQYPAPPSHQQQQYPAPPSSQEQYPAPPSQHQYQQYPQEQYPAPPADSPGLGMPPSAPSQYAMPGLGLPGSSPGLGMPPAQSPGLGMPTYGAPQGNYAPAPVYGGNPGYGAPVYGAPMQPVIQPVYGYVPPQTSVVHVVHGKMKYKHKKGYGYY